MKGKTLLENSFLNKFGVMKFETLFADLTISIPAAKKALHREGFFYPFSIQQKESFRASNIAESSSGYAS
ncbi:MAG TPA: hypothetical protein DIW64_17360 [Cellvibrio sp.]|nr:hypothetical protein [Cellvibrio sp.]